MWIKICGFVDEQNAADVAAEGIDAIGLNFYANSKRFVDVSKARVISDRLMHDHPHVERVGLFVNQSPRSIAQTVDACRLTAIQLHGDEWPTVIDDLRTAGMADSIRIIRAIRSKTPQDAASDISDWGSASRPVRDFLIDACVDAGYGGTGHTIDWDTFGRANLAVPQMTRYILAGGLTPANVHDGVLRTGADGVDVASGVERSPGIKDVESVRRFIAAARRGDHRPR